MNKKVRDLSEYIDKLNAGKRPKEHGLAENSSEMEALFETVRRIHSLKEPALPDTDFPQKVARAATSRISLKKAAKKPKWGWVTGTAAVAAIVVAAILLNIVLPTGKTNIVYAMEQAFQGVKAYHGILEIVETNAAGQETVQGKQEIWADREGHYYVKGLEGAQQGFITVNNGQKKWQVRPDSKQVYVFSAFPDPYSFTFDLGKEVEGAKDALKYEIVGEEIISGRTASILKVSPKGGAPYRIWIDKETRLPLQRQSGMQNALQYTVTYTEIEFTDTLPVELMAYRLPAGFGEIDTHPEQVVNTLDEAAAVIGFTPNIPRNIPEGYTRENIAVVTDTKTLKLIYTAPDKQYKVIVLEGKAVGGLNPASTAILGKVDNHIAEIQSPVQANLGILTAGEPYAGVMDISSIRWQENGVEYAVVGNASLEELTSLVKGLAQGEVQIPSAEEGLSNQAQVKVPVDLAEEENEQKSVDAGHSPWKLDPAFVAQVFVSLKISPEGIQGDYPIPYEDFTVIQNNGKEAIVEVAGDITPIRKVYLERLIRQDDTGIWSVVGYDPVRET